MYPKIKLMESLIIKYRLQPGDGIVVPKSGISIVQHHAVYLGKMHFPEEMVIENVYGKRVQLVSADAFFTANQMITRIERFNGSSADRAALCQRALVLVGKPYNLFHFNCEHLSTRLRSGRGTSTQVGKFLFFTLTGLLIGKLLLTQKSRKK